MRSYTTLGSGKATKVLAVADHLPARTVTTCTADAATGIARRLEATDRQMLAALYPLARHLDGTPVEARRHLLGVYDTVTGGGTVTDDDLWQTAHTLVARLADAVAGQPAPVVAAVRAELAGHLAGLDGVLVPARATAGGYKRANLDLVVSSVLDQDSWWDYVLQQRDLTIVEDDQLFPAGGRCVTSQEFHDLTHQLYDAEPAGSAWSYDFGMKQLMELEDGEGFVDLGIRLAHLLAWVAHHRPDDLARVKEILAP